MQQSRPIYRALLSVYDKNGIIEFASALLNHGIELISTSGTAQLLMDANLSVTEVSTYTDFPEIMGGRMKTLHPKIHGGILGRRGTDDAIMRQHKIKPIDMVVVNLYPFSQTIKCLDISLEKAIEHIDIGGLTMIRAAAKNYQDVVIIIQSSDYSSIIQEMDINNGLLGDSLRFNLAIKAFEYTAAYDKLITNYLSTLVPAYNTDNKETCSHFPRTLNLRYIKQQDMRYGENPHQQAALYTEENARESSVAIAEQVQGKAMSYNNIVDADAALECVKEFNEPACVIVKHATPCGVAINDNILTAYERAYQTDPNSAFGGIIAFNRELNAATVQSIISRQFVEVIVAPGITGAARIELMKKHNVRLLVSSSQWQQRTASLDFKCVNAGLLVQDHDLAIVNESDLRVVSKRQPTKQEFRDALFSWKVVKFVKSNAIVYARDNMTIGIGAGQMNRLYSTKIAAMKAANEKLAINGSTMASDAFFPFRDGIDAAATIGVTCIIQPGGSIRDAEIIAAADHHGMSMIFTGMRHFRH